MRIGQQAVGVTGVIFEQRAKRGARPFGEATAVLHFLTLGAELAQFAGFKRKRVEFLQLKGKQVEAGGAVRFRTKKLLQSIRQGLPLDVMGCDQRTIIEQAAKMIEQVALDILTSEALVEVLAVNVEHQFAERFELRQRHGITVNKSARATVGIDNPPQQAITVEIECLIVKPGSDRR